MITKHNIPRSQHTGRLPIGGHIWAPEPTSNTGNQQLLANALRGGSNIMPRDLSNISLTQEEELQVRMLMQQGMSREQAIQSLPRIQHG
jgi:hypothetical protein